MATRKIAVSTQLKNAQARIAELEKSVATEKQYRGWAEEAKKEPTAELEQVHAFFDALPGALPRKTGDGYDATKYTAMTRLAAWLATKPA